MASFREIQTRDMGEAWDGQGLPPGVRRTFVAALGAVLVAAVPYAVPGLERFRAWVPADGPPFAGLFRTDAVGPVGHYGVAAGEPRLEEAEIEALAATAALEDDAPAVDAPAVLVVDDDGGPPGPGAAVAVPPARPEGDAPPGEPAPEAPSGDLPAAAPEHHARVVIPPETWAGVEVLVEDPHGAMAPFYEKLRRTALQEDGAVTRIAHWGDSAIGADGMTSVARRLLQRQFGDSGHGFILVESGSDWYKHKDVRYGRSGWKASKIIDDADKLGMYGFGGVVSRGYLGARAWFATVDEGPVGRHVGRFDVYYRQAPQAGDLELRVDGGEPTVLQTAADALGDGVHRVAVPDGPHRLDLKVAGGGPVWLYGVALERDRPGVVYDSLGLVGARGSRLLNADPEHWKRQLALREPDLLVLMYGGNELVDRGMSMDWYRKTFTELVRRFRQARPEAACLVLSPLDHGERWRGGIRTDPMLLEMMPVQREVALAEGCAWYSVFDAMGGEGSMGRWFRATPRLGWGDLAHPTKEGARVLGDRFYRALMKGFADWLEAFR